MKNGYFRNSGPIIRSALLCFLVLIIYGCATKPIFKKPPAPKVEYDFPLVSEKTLIPIIDLINSGNLDKFESLLKKGELNPDAWIDDEGFPGYPLTPVPYYLVEQTKSLAVAEILVRNGANPGVYSTKRPEFNGFDAWRTTTLRYDMLRAACTKNPRPKDYRLAEFLYKKSERADKRDWVDIFYICGDLVNLKVATAILPRIQRVEKPSIGMHFMYFQLLAALKEPKNMEIVLKANDYKNSGMGGLDDYRWEGSPSILKNVKLTDKDIVAIFAGWSSGELGKYSHKDNTKVMIFMANHGVKYPKNNSMISETIRNAKKLSKDNFISVINAGGGVNSPVNGVSTLDWLLDGNESPEYKNDVALALIRAGEKSGKISADSAHPFYKADRIGLHKVRDEIAKASAKDAGAIYLKAEESANANNTDTARYWLNHANRLGYNANSNSRVAKAISVAEQRIAESEREQQRRRDSYASSTSGSGASNSSAYRCASVDAEMNCGLFPCVRNEFCISGGPEGKKRECSSSGVTLCGTGGQYSWSGKFSKDKYCSGTINYTGRNIKIQVYSDCRDAGTYSY